MKLAALFICVIYSWIALTMEEPSARHEFSVIAFAFQFYGIVPEYLNEAPKEVLKMSSSRIEINLGTRIYASQVFSEPKLSWNCDPHSLYTLYMFDPDPLGQMSRLLAEVSHWVVGNIRECDIRKGQVLVDYHPPSPPIDTGSHRYIFLLFKQKGNINFEEQFIARTQVEGILYTTAKKFILKYNLGRPLAGNFYLCEYDWQSNITLAKLGPIPEYAQNAFTLAALEREQKKNIVINLK